MKRRHFIKNAGVAGVCSCFVARALAADSAAPAVADAVEKPAQPTPEERRAQWAKARYSKLLTLVATQVDEKTFGKIVEDVGEFCAQGGGSKFVGQLDGFLANVQKRWGATTSYDPATKTVELAFTPKTGDCSCPLMGKGLVPAAACRCSIGSMRKMFSTVMAADVTVDLKESVLQGGTRCAFVIRA